MIALDPLLQVLGDVMQRVFRQEPVFPGACDGRRVGAGPIRADPVGREQGMLLSILRKKRLDASRSRVAVRRKSTGVPCLSMARYRYRHWPRILMYVSSTRIEPQCGLRNARSRRSISGA